MSKITLDNLSDNLKAYLEGLGLSEEQVLNLINENELDEEELKAMLKDTMSINELSTNSKTVIGAINELFQSANNGKELIANAIGEPLSSEDTFSAMSNDINSLLSQFKTNMMNNGVTVESGDRFKSLIDKIATLADNEGKGMRIIEGQVNSYSGSGLTCIDSTNPDGYKHITLPLTSSNFTPVVAIACHTSYGGSVQYLSIYSSYLDNVHAVFFNGTVCYHARFEKSGVVKSNSVVLPVLSSISITSNPFSYTVIGIGEEDTTLRDSLASILQEEGVSVTEEDDMDSLISKVDSEFNKDEIRISELESENAELKLANENDAMALLKAMKDAGWYLNGNENISELVEIINTDGGMIFNDIVQITTGQNHVMVLKKDGTLWGCGSNVYGELGLNTTTTRFNTFKKINGISDIKQLCGQRYGTVILKNDGTVWGCGWDCNGALGLNTDGESFTVFTELPINNVKYISCGEESIFALKNDGTLWACGYNHKGNLGIGQYPTSEDYFRVISNNINNDVAEIFVGTDECTFLVKHDGTLWACGINQQGQLGLGENVDDYRYPSFTQVTSFTGSIKELVNLGPSNTDGHGHTVILKTDGTVWATGCNDVGQLGLGDTTNRNVFTQVPGLNNIRHIACCSRATFVVKDDYSLWACGDLLRFGLADRTKTFVQITTNINNDVNRICGGTEGSMYVIKFDGTLWSCGTNGYGELGLSNYNNKTSFTNTNFSVLR